MTSSTAQTRSLRALLGETIVAFQRDNGPSFAAALAFRALFSFAPLVVIVVAVAGLILGPEAAEAEVLALIGSQVGEDIERLVRNVIQEIAAPGAGLRASIIAGAVIVYGAVRVVAELKQALNVIWNVEPSKQRGGILGWLIVRAVGVLMVVAGGVVLALSMIATTVLQTAVDLLPLAIPPPVTGLLSEAVLLMAAGVVFAIAFRVLPDRKIAWRDVWLGALVTACLFTAGKVAIGFYISVAGIRSTFGAAGTLVALLAWVNFTSMMILFGAEFTHTYAVRRGSLSTTSTEREPAAQPGDAAGKVSAESQPRPIVSAIIAAIMLMLGVAGGLAKIGRGE